MTDHYGGFNMDNYAGGNSYQRSQQQYNQRGPAQQNYDPSRIGNATLPQQPLRHNVYQQQNSHAHTHRALMPAAPQVGGPLAAPPAMQPLHGLVDFDPVPLSTATMQRMTMNHHQASLLQNHQQATYQQQEQQRQQQQQQNQQAIISASRGSSRPRIGPDPPFSNNYAPLISPPIHEPPKPKIDPWLEELRMDVAGLSLEPMSGTDVLQRIETRTNQVATRYLPCVEFLVQCQQELRKGLAAATSKRMVQHMFRDAMTPRQFYNAFIATLPQRFFHKNRKNMNPKDLEAAVEELQKLCNSAQGVERQGCEVVKNTFLGGMKDGESWGLRKWLSKHGGALMICNDSECILHSCQKLDRSLDSTRKLSERLRPIAKRALMKLKAEVPSSYQEHSTAHPYLPFFHRLEAALKGMSNFDPEDDDVICIDDDDEVEELKAKPPPPAVKKERKKETAKRKKSAPAASPLNAGKRSKSESPPESDGDFASLLESPNKLSLNVDTNDDAAYMQELLKTFDDDIGVNDLFGGAAPDFDSIALPIGDKRGGESLAKDIGLVANMFEANQWNLVRPSNIEKKGFWDDPLCYARGLRIFVDILNDPDSSLYLDPVDQTFNCHPPYSSVIRHPICFRSIVAALVENTDEVTQTVTSNNGRLQSGNLASWNMWNGSELLQAIDLVFLNALAYSKASNEGKSKERSKTNKLRNTLWTGIRLVIDTQCLSDDQEEKRKCTPTRRGDTSGFVVFKDK